MSEIKREIYFPEIEVYDDNWLKYALLYKNGIVSMIPEYEDSYFTEKHMFIQSETDFFNYFNDFGHFMSVNNSFRGLVLALEEMDSPRDFDSRYSSLHDCFLRQEKSIEMLNGKMTHSLEEDLVKIGYGVKSDGKFFVSRNLATLYMGMMAESIGYSKKLKVSSTQARYSEYQSILKNLEPYGYHEKGIIVQNQDFKELIIDQSLPVNIKDITIPMIIRLRNKGKYQRELTAYNELLLKIDDYIKNENVDLNKNELINELTSRRSKLNTFIQSDFGTEIFSYAVSAMVSTPPNPLIDIGTSYMVTKSIPHVRKLLRLPNIDVTQQEIKSVNYMQTSWANIDI